MDMYLKRSFVMVKRLGGINPYLEYMERAMVILAIKHHQGNCQQAANYLEIGRTTLVEKRRRLGILKKTFNQKRRKEK